MLYIFFNARLVSGICRVPASAVNIQVGGEYQAMTKTTDNYWLATSGPYTFPTSVQVTSLLGDTVTDVVNVASPSGAVVGGAQFPLSAAYGVVGGMLPALAVCKSLSLACLRASLHLASVSIACKRGSKLPTSHSNCWHLRCWWMHEPVCSIADMAAALHAWVLLDLKATCATVRITS